MVDLAGELDGWQRPATWHRWGWTALVEGLHACIEQGRTSIRRVDAAHARVCRSRAVTNETVRDLGLSRADILGEPTWQADLPFFMQRDFR